MTSNEVLFLNNLTQWLGVRMKSHYEYFLQSYELESRYAQSFDLDSSVLWINHVHGNYILRLNLNIPTITIRAKFLYNEFTKESIINVFDFTVNKIQLRTGGFGSQVVDTLCDMQHKWLSEIHGIEPNGTKIVVFKPLSIPFWLRNKFTFSWMREEDDENKEWGATYKLIKLLVLLNSIQNLNQFIHNFEILTLDSKRVDEILFKQVISYHNKMYNDNLQLKKQIIDKVDNDWCPTLSRFPQGFCEEMIYKNACNQLANEMLGKMGIIPIIWETFYLEKQIYC